jgi:hypothetical protein
MNCMYMICGGLENYHITAFPGQPLTNNYEVDVEVGSSRSYGYGPVARHKYLRDSMNDVTATALPICVLSIFSILLHAMLRLHFCFI